MIEIPDEAIARAAEERETTPSLVLDDVVPYGALGAKLVVVTSGQADAILWRWSAAG